MTGTTRSDHLGGGLAGEDVRAVGAALAYLACMAVFAYAVAERQVGYGNDAANAAILAGVALLHLAAGLAVGRWWAVLLPAASVVIALPAGYPDANQGEPLPIWLGLALTAPVACVLIAAGVATWNLARRRARP